MLTRPSNTSNKWYVGCVVGIPTFGMWDSDFAMNVMMTSYPINFSPSYMVIRDKQVAVARNLIVENALAMNAKYVLFRDDDVLLPPNSVDRLVNLDVDISGGIYFSKSKPPFPLIFRGKGNGSYIDWYGKIGIPLEATGIGMGATLIKTKVFHEMDKPWFRTVSKLEEHDDGRVSAMTEDIFFCDRAIKAGFQIWADTGVLCAHKDTKSGTVYFYDTVSNCPGWVEKDSTEIQVHASARRHARADKLGEFREQYIEQCEVDKVKVLRIGYGPRPTNGSDFYIEKGEYTDIDLNTDAGGISVDDLKSYDGGQIVHVSKVLEYWPEKEHENILGIFLGLAERLTVITLHNISALTKQLDKNLPYIFRMRSGYTPTTVGRLIERIKSLGYEQEQITIDNSDEATITIMVNSTNSI